MQREWSVKKIVTTALIVLAVIVGITILVKSIKNIEPGHRGVVFYKWGEGLDTKTVYSEGWQLIAPWNELITYDVRQKNVDLTMDVLDKNGLNVGVDVSIAYRPMAGSIGDLHLKTGRDYESIVVIPRTRSAGREVTGQFDSEELYATKRDQLQTQIELILKEKFELNFLFCEDVLIRDVNLPNVITQAIIDKQEQEQKNELAEKLEAEATSKANAAIAKSEGIKQSAILEAEGQAESIRLKQLQLQKSPEYIKLQYALAAKTLAEKGVSMYGNNNVFGDASIFKGLPGGVK